MGYQTIVENLKKSDGLDRFLIIFVLLGVVLVAVSFFRGILMDSQVQVEVLDQGKGVNIDSIEKYYVDIEGAVVSPGVYQLPQGSRVIDVLVSAGGLSGEADRVFCEKNINMAELVKDGQKIYIPFVKETSVGGYIEADSEGNMISINTATVSDLDTLWGIGASRAEDIVKNRPYQSVDELVTKGVLPKSVVEKIRGQLSVY